MAYQNNNPPKTGPDFTDKSILVQVAFKGAVEALGDGVDLTEAPGQQVFNETFGFLADVLFSEVSARAGSAPAAPTPPPAGYDAALRLQQEFGATENYDDPAPNPVVSGGTLEVKKQKGTVPNWLFEDAAAAGVVEVWDNRDGLAENPRRPWFKATNSPSNPLNAKGEAFAFWPPEAA